MLTLPLLLLLSADPTPALRLAGDPPTAVEATGLATEPAVPAAVLAVVLADGTAAEIAARRPLLGTYSFRNGVLRFEPRFPFAPGVRYRATLTTGGRPVTKDFTVPKPRTEPGRVTAVSPSADKLPENTLRLYVHFSKPMSRGDVYRYVKLLNEPDGKPVERPFLELDEELWSPDRTRFTLLIDPGRIKREVKPREDLGPVLTAGKRYTLVIEGGWPDGDGNPLAEPFRKTFTATPSDRTAIDPSAWAITPPKPGPGKLVVKLGKPLDAALLQRLVWVTDATGAKLGGVITLSDHESVWAFESERPWAAGRYKLVVDPRLEDVCGNRVGEPFEVDITKAPPPKADREPVAVLFEVK